MGVTVKNARLFADLTQSVIAEKLGVHRQTYAKWERNSDTMPIGYAKKFASVVGLELEQIFFTPDSTLSRQNSA